MSKRVRNKDVRVGYWGHKRRYPGTEFSVPDDEPLGTWMELVELEDDKPTAKRKRRAEEDSDDSAMEV